MRLTEAEAIRTYTNKNPKEIKSPPPLTNICHTYPTMMKLGTVIPYLQKIQRIYESRDTSLESADIRIFSPEVCKFCYIKKYRYSLIHF